MLIQAYIYPFMSLKAQSISWDSPSTDTKAEILLDPNLEFLIFNS